MDLNNYIEEIKQKVDIVDYISKYVELKKSGRNFVGLCPFHSEKTPSFTVSREKGIFYCFGCKTGGNVIEFTKKFENLTFKEVVEHLSKFADLPAPEWKEVKISEEDDNLYLINSEVSTFFKNCLKNNPLALSYLKEREIDDNLINDFSIGYAPYESERLIKYLNDKNININNCLKIGILSNNSEGEIYSYFRDRLIFPILDINGKTIGFGGRTLKKNEEPKYLNSPESVIFRKGKNLYGLDKSKNEIKKEKNVIIVEGYMDLISLYKHSVKNVIASLGTAFTLDQARILKRYAEIFYFCLDNDEAGRIATKRAFELLTPLELNCQAITGLSPYKDPDEFINNKGKDDYLMLLNKSINSFEYLWNGIKNGKNFKDPVELANVVAEIFSIVIKLKNNILLETYLKIISSDTKISLRSLNDELAKFKNSIKKEVVNRSKPSFNSKEREKLLLKALITMNEDFVQLIIEKITLDDFVSPNERELFNKLSEIYKNNGHINYNIIFNLLDENLKQLLSELIMIDDSFLNERSILETLNKFESEKKLNYLRTNLTNRAVEAEKSGDLDLSRRLLEEVKKIV
jgi:DNA primase